MSEVSQKYEADRVENIKQARNLVSDIPEGDFTPFESTSEEVSELIDDLDHPIKYLFGDIHDKIKNINSEMDSVFEVSKPSVRRRATETLFLLSTMLSVAGCKSSPYKSPEDIKEPTPLEESINTLQEEVTPTPTVTPEPTYTATPTPTETLEPTPTPTEYVIPTPIIEGDIDQFLEESNTDFEIVKNMLTIQDIVNSYSPESGLGFGEYISSRKQEFENNEENSNVLKMLGDLEGYDKINTLILARVMQENLPELGIIDIESWSEDKAIDIIPTNIVQYMNDATEMGLGYPAGLRIYDGSTILGYLPVEQFISGDLVFNADNYDQLDKESDFSLIIVISRLENAEGISLLGTAINEDGKIALIEINKDNIDEVFGHDVIILMEGPEGLK